MPVVEKESPLVTEKPRTDWTEWFYRFAVLALLVLIFVPFMGSFGLWDPWETHYGEVGRQMVERGDWISPWWGSHWIDGVSNSEGRYFFSKPVMLLWMMGIGLQMFGFSDWGIRFGVGMVVIFASLMVYIMGRQVWNRRAGIIMTLVITTSPFWSMLGRQAQTDMPYVGLMTIGMCFFMMAVFGKQREQPATRVDMLLFYVTYLAIFIPQMQLLAVKFQTMSESGLPWIARFIHWGPTQVTLYSLGVLTVIITHLALSKNKTKGQLYLFGFYLFIALATLAKGLLGFALPGAIILLYLVITKEWRMLARVELLRGGLLFITVAFPWYMAMLIQHGRSYVDRFFVHDHLRRLASGVHQTDSGSFEHFVKWLGYGLFPWVAFIPAALSRIVVGKEFGTRTDEQRGRIFLMLWFVTAFCLFTLASTKFHHYIFPCVPALAMLVGLFLEDLLGKRIKGFVLLYLSALALFLMVGYDLVSEPQGLKNLFTYQYDRMWHSSLTPEFVLALKIVFAVGLLGLVLLVFRQQVMRTIALCVLFISSTGLTVWALDIYMPKLAVDWSQGYLWDTYYTLCTPSTPARPVWTTRGNPTIVVGLDRAETPPGFKHYCEEAAVSYRLNWRGETYYTRNEVLPLDNEANFRHFLSQNDGRSFFAIMLHTRYSHFRTALPAELREGLSRVHTENDKFILVRVLNEQDRRAHLYSLGDTETSESDTAGGDLEGVVD